MRLRSIMGSFLFLATLSFWMLGCGGSSGPSSPAAPANTPTITGTPTETGTNTPSGTPTATRTDTGTSTPSGTPTSSGTPTPSSTPSDTRTSTPTFTITNTPTDTGTSTQTGTPTDTLTITPTFTITNTPTVTATFTITDTPLPYTPTPTSTPTRTATSSPTFTNTTCPTQAPTNTPNAGTYSIAGTLTDSSPVGTVDANHPLVLLLPGSNTGQPPVAFLNSSSGSYGPIGVATPGNYSVVFWHNTVGDGHVSNPHVGDYAKINGTSTCLLSSGTQVNVNGVLSAQNFSFSDTNQLLGYAGTISYTGATVNYCHQLHVEVYQPGTVTAHSSSTAPGSNGANCLGDANNGGISTSGARYDAIPYKSSTSMCSAQNVDILAYYDISGGSNGAVTTGDPYVLYSSVSTSLSTGNNIALNGSSSTW